MTSGDLDIDLSEKMTAVLSIGVETGGGGGTRGAEPLNCSAGGLVVYFSPTLTPTRGT